MHVKRGDLASVSRLVPFILLYPEGKAAVVRSIQQTAGPSVAVVEQFDVGCEVSALYDEPRLFESWSGDFIAVRMPFLAAGSDPPFGFAWMAKQMWIERALFRDISIAAVLMTGLSLVPPLT